MESTHAGIRSIIPENDCDFFSLGIPEGILEVPVEASNRGLESFVGARRDSRREKPRRLPSTHSQRMLKVDFDPLSRNLVEDVAILIKVIASLTTEED